VSRSRSSKHGNARSSSPDSDWRSNRKKFKSVVKEGAEIEANKLNHMLHQAEVDISLLRHGIKRLREALVTEKKYQKKGKVLDLQQRQE
jgi:hypothetical protein